MGMFLGYPFLVSLGIMASHGLTVEKALECGYSVSLQDTVLMSMENIFLLMEMDLDLSRFFKIPLIIQRKYSVYFHILRSYPDEEDRALIVKELYKRHKKFPYVFGRSEYCIVCLLFSLQESAKYPSRKEKTERYYCPFDEDKKDLFWTLKRVADHLQLTSAGCQGVCEHLEKKEIRKKILQERLQFSFDSLDVHHMMRREIFGEVSHNLTHFA